MERTFRLCAITLWLGLAAYFLLGPDSHRDRRFALVAGLMGGYNAVVLWRKWRG